MATQPILVHLDLNQNEIQNAVAQNLATAPSNPVEGQEYYNSTDHKKYIYSNGAWVDETNQGKIYAAGNGIDSTALAAGTVKVSTTIASKTDIGSANLTLKRNGTAIGTFSSNATSAVEVNISVPTTATDVGALPSSTVIGDGKVVFKKNGTAFATATANQTSTLDVDYTIPSVGDGKIIYQKNGTSFATASVNQTSTVTVNYTIPTAVTDLSDASNYALKSDVASAIIPKGSKAAVTDLPTPASTNLGDMYNMSAAFTTTTNFVEGSGKKYPAGTNVVVVEYTSGTYKYDIFSGFVDTDTYDTHLANTTIHVTATDKTTWNGKQDAISDLTTIRANATAGAGAATTIAGYGNIVTHNTSEFATSTQGGKADTAAQTYTTTNPALTTSGGVCSWTVTHNLGSKVCISVYDSTSLDEVICNKVKTSGTAATVKFNSSSNIAAGKYTAVVIGK